MVHGCVQTVTEETFDEEVLQHPGLVLVDFYTQSCPPCRRVAPILEELCAERQDRLKIVKVDAAENPSISLGFTGVPTFQLFREGQKVSQISGFQSKDQFIRWIAAAE